MRRSVAAVLLMLMAIASPALAGQVDHLVLGVSDLNAGIEEFRSRTGVEPVFGGNHPNGGTRNALASLGDGIYIEIIAPNPDAELSPMFGSLKNLSTLTPIMWAAAVDDAEAAKALLVSKGHAATPVMKGSRVKPDGSVLKWQTVAVPSSSSYLPFFIQWDKDSTHPSKSSPAGCSLVSLSITDPNPEALEKLLAAFQLTPDVKTGSPASFAIVLKCPKGEVRFDSAKGS
ncbi:MAG TPA: VOC family protein [Thermoanaerobaculia bacterium]|nr:VOC family protein [Thermoanaerobaculia bacterium]